MTTHADPTAVAAELRMLAEQLGRQMEAQRMGGDELAVRVAEPEALGQALERAAETIERLNGLINTPHTDDWFEAVRLEAAHQVERWGAAHDAGKTPLDWFWLIGYLAQKATYAELGGDRAKALHHTVSTAAVLLNWHRRIQGQETAFRPGINPARDAVAAEAQTGATA